MDDPLGPRAHRVHLVRRVAVLEEALEEDAQEPVAGEEGVNHALLDSGTVMSLSRRVKKIRLRQSVPGPARARARGSAPTPARPARRTRAVRDGGRPPEGTAPWPIPGRARRRRRSRPPCGSP